MSELTDLYQDLILDHNAHPHNFGDLPDATHKANGVNPLCGDHITIFLTVDANERITNVRFSGKGCAISKASASLMTCQLKGKTCQEAEALFSRFHALVTTGEDGAEALESMGKLAAFASVHAYPMRVKCATLAWHTLRAALQPNTPTVTTE